MERFCDRVIERGLDMNFWSYARVDTILEALLPKMKKAGLNWLCLGIESANERVCASVNKMLRRDIVSTVRKIQDHGICIIGNYMFGLPEEDAGTMQETLDLALELNCEFVNFYTVMAYPGSAVRAGPRGGDRAGPLGGLLPAQHPHATPAHEAPPPPRSWPSATGPSTPISATRATRR